MWRQSYMTWPVILHSFSASSNRRASVRRDWLPIPEDVVGLRGRRPFQQAQPQNVVQRWAYVDGALVAGLSGRDHVMIVGRALDQKFVADDVAPSQRSGFARPAAGPKQRKKEVPELAVAGAAPFQQVILLRWVKGRSFGTASFAAARALQHRVALRRLQPDWPIRPSSTAEPKMMESITRPDI